MSKTKYYFDSDNLEFVPIKNTLGNRIYRLSLFLISSVIFGAFITVILFNTDFVNTPKEIVQEREIDNYELQLKVLNKKLEQVESTLANIEKRDNNLYRAYFEASPIPEDQRKAGFGGINRYDYLEGFESSDLIVNTTERLDILTKELVIQSKSLDEIELLAKNKESLLSSIPSIQPVNSSDLRRMASGYGYRIDPFTKARRMHFGMDFSAKRGTPIYATGDGTVSRADSRAAGFGKHVRIDHGFGYVSIYAHMDRYVVVKGDKVKRGDLIGYVGSSGRSVAPHLHYEIVKDGVKINPINFYSGSLSPAEFEELVKVASQENQSLD
ncbi:MAG: peptidoglycan DD-metalloendopeptidase family protein [Bacteroidota bacterium]|nr:peptidoglycan DD-metalloendopeptidase family protein [Bacteroidota bacterium]MEC8612004.1 peptidoglycan DD-metalloendopeptidase family protein [Bacteroidota bacterium]|tara:strand:+ start:820 stop:1797 length:978 start_codon:yes stop_codon:yes gene_type:complete